jgi:hypothetical protein
LSRNAGTILAAQSRKEIDRVRSHGTMAGEIERIMADIIDLALLSAARRILRKVLDQRGIAYFLSREGKRLMQIDPSKVDIVVRSAARARAREEAKPSPESVDYCRRRVRRELIRRVAKAMIEAGY